MSKDFNWDEIKNMKPELCKDCGSLEEAIKQCVKLEQLFSLWKAAHKYERDADSMTFPLYDKRSTPKEEFMESFCRDGITSLSGKENSNIKAKVLFILKEANLADGTDIAPETSDQFWFKDCPDDKTRKGYAENLKAALNKLKITPDKAEPFGYMNLNKRGGYGKCCPERLKNYTQKYKAFILKEIEILSPEVIICCGCFDVVAEAFGLSCWEKGGPQRFSYADGTERSAIVYYIYHPSNKPHIFNKSLENLNRLVQD